MRTDGFRQTFAQSITSTSYYRSLANKPVSITIRHYLLGMLLVGAVFGIVRAVTDSSWWYSQVQQARSELVSAFPTDLELKWDGSQLTSSQPITAVAYPANFTQLAHELELPSQAAQFSLQPTNETDQPSQPTSDPNSLLHVTNTQVSIRTISGSRQTVLLSDVVGTQPLSITKNTIADQSAAVLQTWTRPVFVAVGTLSTVLLMATLVVSRFFIALIESLFCFLLLRALGQPMTYVTLVRYSLHVLVFAEIANQVAQLLYPTLSVSWVSVSYWMLMSFILLSNLRIPRSAGMFE